MRIRRRKIGLLDQRFQNRTLLCVVARAFQNLRILHVSKASSSLSLEFEFNGRLKFKSVATRSMSAPCMVICTFQCLKKTSGTKSTTNRCKEAAHKNVVRSICLRDFSTAIAKRRTVAARIGEMLNGCGDGRVPMITIVTSRHIGPKNSLRNKRCC